MTITHLGAVLLSIVFLAGPACKSKEAGVNQKSGIVAVVNGVAITEDDLYLRMGGDHGGAAAQAMRGRFIDDLINQELLYQNGVKLGLDKDAKYRNAVRILEVKLQGFKRSEMARRVMNTRIAATVNVTNEDVSRYIEQNADRLRMEYHVGMMCFPGETEAQAARGRIQGGETFERLAGRQQPHALKTGKVSWDLGYLPWGRLPATWQGALDRLEKGAVSDALFDDKTGYCLVKLIDRKRDSKVDLRSMNASVMNRLRDEKILEASQQYLQQLKKEATIQRSDERRE